jgi:alkyl hydroperoxide reductase subunit AhpC
MLPAEVEGDPRSPADNQTVRNVFVIGPDKKIKLILVYPMTTGQLRRGPQGDRLQLTAAQGRHPRQRQQGDDIVRLRLRRRG